MHTYGLRDALGLAVFAYVGQITNLDVALNASNPKLFAALVHAVHDIPLFIG